MPAFTLIVPYYRQPGMLQHQIMAWEHRDFPREIPIIVVDDGSKEPARDVITRYAGAPTRARIALYRVDVDIPWNRGGARNLGTREAQTEWIVHVDIDHVLKAAPARLLLDWTPNPAHWYRFERFRVGCADDTRNKDEIPRDATHGKIKPHMDSYLTTRKDYWAVGGYDEDYSGCLGGGTPFTKALARHKPVMTAPENIHLDVWTRSMVADSSEMHLSRDPAEYKRRRTEKEASGRTVPTQSIRFPWHREAL